MSILDTPGISQNQLNAAIAPTPTQIATSRTLTALDNGKVLECTAATTITVPAGLPAGFICTIIPYSTTTIASGGGSILNGAASSITREVTNGTLINIRAKSTANSYVVMFAVDGDGNSPNYDAISNITNWSKQPLPQLTATATGRPTVYWPWVINANEHIAGAMGKYYMYYSTDHDATVGGIGMAYSDSPTGPWTVYGQVYADTATSYGSGGQTETPSVIWDRHSNTYRMYYQQIGAKYGAGNTLNGVGWQSTLSCTSSDGINWTKDPNFINDIPSLTAQHGDGHTGYFLPWEIDGQLCAYSLYGGGNGPDFVLWRSDGQSNNFSTDGMTLGYSLDRTQGAPLNGRRTEWNASFVVKVGGQNLIFGIYSNFVSGAAPADKLICVSPVSDDFRRVLGRPSQIWTPTLGWESANLRQACPFIDNGVLYIYYSVNATNIGVISHAI